MKLSAKHTVCVLLGLASMLLTGCQSSEKLVNQKYQKGAYLKTNSSQPVETKRETLLSLYSNKVEAKQKVSYAYKDTKVYEKKLELRYKREEGTSVGDMLVATMLTPLALVGDALTLGGLTVGEAAPFTTWVWEDVADPDTSYVRKTAIVPDEYIEESSNKYTSKMVTLANTTVTLYLNNKKATSIRTNQNGVAYFDSLDLLLQSNIHPKDLIRGEGLKVIAIANGVRDNITISNSSISDEYFATKFKELNAELMQREVRLDNCQAISNGYREIFECFYQG